MKTIRFFAIAACSALLAVSCNNSSNAGVEAELPTAAEVDSVSYLLGVNIGSFFKGNGFAEELKEINMAQFKKGMNDFLKAEGNPRAILAHEMLVYQIKKFIGAYAAAMGGLDAIVFTAGIGENSIDMREKLVEGLEYMGCKIDPEKNNVRGKEVDVSAADSKVKIFVIPTNEELMIAKDTAALAK